jgi:uncharacterized protein
LLAPLRTIQTRREGRMTGTPRITRRQRWLRRLRFALIFYLALFLLLSCAHATDRLVLFPTTESIDARGAQRELLRLAVGTHVELWHARSPGAAAAEPAAFVLFFTGNADRADRWAASSAASWGDKPVQVTGMNYPGFGGSTGPARLASIAPAAAATYDTLRARAGKRPIIVQGNSLGTAAALHLLATRDVAFASIHNPPPIREIILGRHGWWNLWLGAMPLALSVPGELDSIANARHTKAPALFILSQHDEVVPIDYQRRVYENYAGPKRLLEFPHTHNTGMDNEAWAQVRTGLDALWGEIVHADSLH